MYRISNLLQKNGVLALLDSGKKVNAITLAFISKLYLKVRFTNVEAQKINSFILITYRIVIAIFQADNELGKAKFFKKSFLVAETSVDVLLVMFFLAFSNVDVKFAAEELI